MMIVALVKDLFFISKIKETAIQLNKEIFFIKNYDELKDFFDKINGNIKLIINGNIKLIIIDLNFNDIKPLETIQEIKSIETLKNKKIIAYCSHVQTELMNKAKELGIEVMPKSLFTSKLEAIIKN